MLARHHGARDGGPRIEGRAPMRHALARYSLGVGTPRRISYASSHSGSAATSWPYRLTSSAYVSPMSNEPNVAALLAAGRDKEAAEAYDQLIAEFDKLA